MDPALLSALLNAPKAANAIACFLGLAESIDKKAQKLCSTPYNSAMRFLRSAESSETQQEHLLREAQRSFTDALTLEAGSRLAIAYIGLAMCQTYLGDTLNAAGTLRELVGRDFGSPQRNTTIAKLAFRVLFPLWALGGAGKPVDALIDNLGRMPDIEAALKLQSMATQHVQRTERSA